MQHQPNDPNSKESDFVVKLVAIDEARVQGSQLPPVEDAELNESERRELQRVCGVLRFLDAVRADEQSTTPQTSPGNKPTHVPQSRSTIVGNTPGIPFPSSTDSPVGYDPNLTGPYVPRDTPDSDQGQSKENLPRQMGRYRLEQVLGKGGGGAVYRAHDLELDRVVAVKILSDAAFQQPEMFARFRTEAEIAAQLNHPNFVQIHEIGSHRSDTGDIPYLVLEFIPGGTLSELLRLGRLPQKQAAQLVETVARAMYTAHLKGILHRDLKPANILLKNIAGLLWPTIADFGLAKDLTDSLEHTRTGQAMGTPAYMSPEQIEGNKKLLGPATDIYSLGCILYECLTGRPPFIGAIPLEVLLRAQHEDAIPPSRLVGSISSDLDTIALKCLEKSPIARYPTAQALADDLQRFLKGEPILARPPSRTERLVKWCRRHPSTAALVSALVCVFLVGFIGITWQYLEAVASRNTAVKATELAFEKAEAEERERKQADDLRKAEAAERKKADEARKLADRNADEAKRSQKLAETKSEDESRARIAEAKQRERAESLLYGNVLDLCRHAWQSNRTHEARDRLRECPPQYQHWEYRYLQNLFVGNQRSKGTRGVSIHGLALSPDGKRLALGLWDGRLSILEFPSGTELTSFDALSRTNNSEVNFSPDGKRVAIVGTAGDTSIWDVETGKNLFRPEKSTFANSVHFHPNGKQIAYGSTGEIVRVLDTESWKDLFALKGHTEQATMVRYTPNGRYLLTADREGKVRVWDAETGELVRTFGGSLGSAISSMDISPDGRMVAVGTVLGLVRIWEVNSGTMLNSFNGNEKDALYIVFHRDNRQLLTCGDDGAIRIWTVDGHPKARTFLGHQGRVDTALFTPDGKVVSGGIDQTWKIWDSESDQTSRVLASVGSQGSAFSRDGSKVVFFQILSISGKKTLKVEVLETRNGGKLWECSGPPTAIPCFAFHPNEKEMLLGFATGKLELRNSLTGETLRTFDEEQIRECYFLGDGRRFAVQDNERTVRIRSTSTGELLDQWFLADKTDRLLAFNRDGSKALVGTKSGRVELWNTATREEPIALEGLKFETTSAAFSPDGNWIVAGCSYGTVMIWDAKSWNIQAELKGHISQVKACVFTQDSKRLFTASFDSTVRVWRPESGQQLLILQQTAGIDSIQLCDDGERLLGVVGDHTLRVWNDRKK